ncbi:hypothetical protein [Thiomonas sp. FB-Cd]|uniref:hypothetical protein n=1 Tax=Thiomonas sp. FB-Cd TaxID=1158292 RepID=UPI0004DF9074|nr:hypothetical protein [Thiomonas sp. FB-Cd]
MNLPTLEVHVPISPTPMFLRQTWALAASLRRFGGAVGRMATLTAWVSPELPGLPDLNRLHAWARPLGVTFRWVDEALFTKHWYYGTALARWAGPFSADVVLMLDADVLVCSPLDELVQTITASEAVWGFPAHFSPFSQTEWQALFADAALPAPTLDCRPSGAGFYPHAREERMPAYFNLGVIGAARAVMERLGQGVIAEMEHFNRHLPPASDPHRSFFRCQVAVALSRARHVLPWEALDVRDNFPNDATFEQAHAGEMRSIRLLHYLRKDRGVSKDADFQDKQAYAALLARPGLSGTNRLLQDRLRALGACPLDGWLQRLRHRWLQPVPQLRPDTTGG